MEAGGRLNPSVLLVLASSGWGGTEKAFVDLANSLAPSCRVSVVVPADAQYLDRFSADVRSVHQLRPGSRRNPLVLRDLHRIIQEEDPDVVHSHAARAAEMVYWVSRFSRIRHVATKHNTRARRVFSRVANVTAVSEAARASVDPPDGVTVVYNGIDLPEPPPVEKRGTFAVLAVGRLHTHKGFDLLIRSVAALPFECSLEIAGEGAERATLEGLVRELGAQARVTLLGHREDVPALMAGAHVLVVSSRTEGFSLALVEGLRCCDVVLSTRVGIAPEVLPDDLLVEPGALADRLKDVRARYPHYEELTRGVRATTADRFQLSRTTERYLEVYERVMKA